MKKEFLFIVLTLLLTGFIFATQENSAQTNTQQITASETNTAKVQSKVISQEMVKEIVQNRNRLRINQNLECPERCTCSGSTIKCQTNEGKEIVIRTGNSSKTIIKVKGVEIQTNAELYQSNGKIYGVFRNQTREIKVLPDQIREKIRERLNLQNESCNMTFDKDGNYEVQTKQRAKLFGFIKIQERLRVQVNSETGEIIKTKRPWWSFLSSVEEKSQ